MMYFKGDYPKKAKMIRLKGHGAEIAKDFFNQNIESLIRYETHAKLYFEINLEEYDRYFLRIK